MQRLLEFILTAAAFTLYGYSLSVNDVRQEALALVKQTKQECSNKIKEATKSGCYSAIANGCHGNEECNVEGEIFCETIRNEY